MSSAAMNPLLTIEDLSLELRRDTQWNPILHHIQFSLSEGETLGIVGESGSGKSVTALSVMQLLNPSMVASYVHHFHGPAVPYVAV